MAEPIRIANCSGFYGDRLSAAREMVDGGPIDVLTGDYLAELTMAILWRARSKDPQAGFASTFLVQMEQVLGTCRDRGIKVVANAGGLNPAGLAERLERLAGDLGIRPKIAWIDGDDILSRLDDLQESGHDLRNLDTGVPLADAGVTPITANAYLGGWGIAMALEMGADVVVTGRVTDAALVLGPAAWHHGWSRDDWSRLAGALVAGHVVECGAQATGGNYSFFREVPGLTRPGFPLVEVEEDGGFTVTKHPGTGGAVSVGTVTAQLLYEIGGPRYLSPDVIARFDTVRPVQEGIDRVRVPAVSGEPPPDTVKVAINHLGGFRNEVTFVLTGLDIEDKARLAEESLWESTGGRDRFAQTEVSLVRWDRPDPASNEEAMAHLRITVKDPDSARVGRAFSRSAIELALASYPGFFVTAPPADASPYAVYWPAVVPADLMPQVVHLDGDAVTVGPPSRGPVPSGDRAPAADTVPVPSGPTTAAPLGAVVGARSGDKGGNANVGVWAASPEAFAWLDAYLDETRFRSLIPETAGLRVDRFALPNLHAVNFVVHGLLGEGVASSTRLDPQAKSLGEYLRAKVVEIPVSLMAEGSGGPAGCR